MRASIASSSPLRAAAEATTAMRALSIAHTEASMGWGGQEIRILTEARGLIARGHRVVLYAAPGARIADEAAGYGVPCTTLPIGRKRPAGVVALARAFRAARPDVVDTHSSTDSWLVALACRFLRDPPAILRTRHVSVPVPNDPATRWLYRRATARVVTTGEALARQLVHDNGLDAARVESIPTGIDASRYGTIPRADARRTLGLPGDVPIVGIVATLRSWKGHRHLVDALARLADARTLLVVVGDGPQREALQRHVAVLGLAGRVRFAGQQRDVVPWLAALDVFALPSTANEGVPQALLQAMFAGIPCVTTRAGALPEIARDGDTALVVPAGDPAALAAAIDRLLADPGLRHRLADAARAHVAPRFSLDTMLDRMDAAFRRAIEDARQ